MSTREELEGLLLLPKTASGQPQLISILAQELLDIEAGQEALEVWRLVLKHLRSSSSICMTIERLEEGKQTSVILHDNTVPTYKAYLGTTELDALKAVANE